MPGIKDLPLEILREIMGYLSVRDKLRALESSNIFEDAIDEQLEAYSRFDLKPHKLSLCLVLDEIECVESTRLALRNYREVNLVLCPNFIDEPSDDDLLRLFSWLHAVTEDGTNLFATIEIVGFIRVCGCRCQNIMR